MRTMEKDGIELRIKEHIIWEYYVTDDVPIEGEPDKDGIELRIKEHIIWEYYVTDDVPIEGEPDIVQALVVGFETELGDVSLFSKFLCKKCAEKEGEE